VDLANPGQYFACCGLLELTNRIWPEAEGWFADGYFRLRRVGNAAEFLRELGKCEIANTMTAEQKRRREELGAMGQKVVKANPALELEKKVLDGLWRESPVVFGEPFGLFVDWFLDERSGGKRFKTWAGQQSIIDIVSELRRLIVQAEADSEGWLATASASNCVPLNFDSNLGAAGADIDIGFSFDPLKAMGLRVAMRPAIEFLAFAGLQRFRPAESDGAWEYGVWARPSNVELSALACCGAVRQLAQMRFRFQLLYRTKYLKSFLPARPV
jgi:CRISPR-associated protein Csb3